MNMSVVDMAIELTICRPMIGGTYPNRRLRVWTPEDEIFLEENTGRIPCDELAQQLGRTLVALNVRRKKRGMPAPSKRPGYLTLNQVAWLLGIDIHSAMKLEERGMLKGMVLFGKRHIRSVSRMSVYRFALRPESWVIVDIRRVKDDHLARLMRRKQALWGDEWWTVGQAAAYHHCSATAVTKAIRTGRLAGFRWGNHYIRKSVAIAAHFYTGKGSATEIHLSERCKAFMLWAMKEGLTWSEIARMMKKSDKWVQHQGHKLAKLHGIRKACRVQLRGSAYNRTYRKGVAHE